MERIEELETRSVVAIERLSDTLERHRSILLERLQEPAPRNGVSEPSLCQPTGERLLDAASPSNMNHFHVLSRGIFSFCHGRFGPFQGGLEVWSLSIGEPVVLTGLLCARSP